MPWYIFAFLGALFAGLTNVLVAAGLKGVNSYLATAVRTVLILPVVWFIALSVARTSDLLKWSPRTWGFLALSAIAAGLSWVCSYKAIALAGAARPAPIDKSSLLFTMILAFIFLNETITPRLALSAGLVLAGALLSLASSAMLPRR